MEAAGTMQFNSWLYLVFLLVLVPVYYCLENRQQKWLLLAISYGFYSLWDWRVTSLLCVVTAVVYIGGNRIASSDDVRVRRGWLIFCLIVTLGILAVFKYCDFFLENLHGLIDTLGFRLDRVPLHIVVPIGLSFYTFQALTYPFDIYRKQLKPRESILDVAVLVAFFPQLAAGPIERARNVLPQLDSRRSFNLVEFEKGVWLIFWGLFKKVFVADNLAVLVNQSFDHSATITFSAAYIALIAYAVQIYCDFSSYTDMARGSAKLFGIRLMDNFNFPYLAENPREFWKRWHISLSTWLRDYVYIPLGGNKQGRLLTYRNVIITMTLCGLWHGAAWNYVLWGLYQGVLLVAYDWVSGRINVVLGKGVSIAVMFHCTLLGWLLFRSTRSEMVDGVLRDQSVDQIMEFMGSVTRDLSPDPVFWSLLENTLFVIWPLFAVEALMLTLNSKYILTRLPSYGAIPIKAGLLFLIVAYGVQTGERFIYFKF